MQIAFFGIVNDIGMAGHTLHGGMDALPILVSRDRTKFASFAILSRNRQHALFAIMAGQATSIIKRWFCECRYRRRSACKA
jgi:hypothetical protein